jgi:hypothetical protein
MVKMQRMSKRLLKQLLRKNSILDGIHQGRYKEVIENEVPAKKISNCRSLIISYYQGGNYICTKHALRTKSGRTVHQDVEAARIGGIKYKRE